MKACQEDGVGRGAQESRRNGAVVHPRAQSGQRRGWGGREFGSGRTQRRCAGGVAAGGVARGEMGEDSLDDLGSLDARDDTQCAATHATVFDVNVEDSREALHPAHGRGTRRMGLAGGLMGRVGDETAAVLEVRGEHAVVSGEMGAGTWHEGGEAGDAKSAGLPICAAGGCPEGVRHTDVPHEFDGVEYDMSGPVTEGVLESVQDLPAVIDREAFVRECWAGDVTAKAFEGVALMGSAARAGMEGESRELSDAGVVRRRPLPHRHRPPRRAQGPEPAYQYPHSNADRPVVSPILLRPQSLELPLFGERQLSLLEHRPSSHHRVGSRSSHRAQTPRRERALVAR